MIGGRREAIELLKQPTQEVKDWLDTFDAVLTDCDGVLWLYDQVIDGSVEVVNRFIDLGKTVYFVTNNSTKTREEFLTKSHRMGFNVDLDGVISTAHLAANYLKRAHFKKTVYVIGSPGIAKELSAVGIQSCGIGPDPLEGSMLQFVENDLKPSIQKQHNIGAVIVGFDEHFSFPKMARACTYLNDPNCLFVATNTDERFPMPNCVIPGTGTMVHAIETGAERKATVMGKPSVTVCQHLIDDKIIVPERTLMIGDRCNTDILLGANCGFQTLLVGTGVHSLEHVKHWKQSENEEDSSLIPDAYLPRLGDLLQFMEDKVKNKRHSPNCR